jgi:Skp family chaperone for outer membrane proteins
MKVHSLLPAVFTVLVAANGLPQATAVVKEGVVNVQEVVRAFFEESKQWRDQQTAAAQVMKRIADYQRQIMDLQDQRITAAGNRDSAKVSQLDKQIQQIASDYQYYRSTELARIDAMMVSLVLTDSFLRNLLMAARAVAEEQGFLTVKKFTDDFLYVAPEVNVTDQVVAKMHEIQQGAP